MVDEDLMDATTQYKFNSKPSELTTNTVSETKVN
jgi:hypothetical protein